MHLTFEPTRWRQKTCCTVFLPSNTDVFVNLYGAFLCLLACVSYLEKNTFGGFFLCAAGDFHLSTCGALSNKETQTKKGNYKRIYEVLYTGKTKCFSLG